MNTILKLFIFCLFLSVFLKIIIGAIMITHLRGWMVSSLYDLLNPCHGFVTCGFLCHDRLSRVLLWCYHSHCRQHLHQYNNQTRSLNYVLFRIQGMAHAEPKSLQNRKSKTISTPKHNKKNWRKIQFSLSYSFSNMEFYNINPVIIWNSIT